MHLRSLHARAFGVAAALTLASAGSASAQAWSYPTFQTPRVTTREFNFGLADADNAGTSLIFQWREGRNARTQLSLDAGLVETDGGADDATFILLGAQLGRQLAVARQDMPFDVLMTAGLFGAFGDGGPFLSIPFGASVGHRFLIDGGMAITPYTHPRLAVTYCGECGDGELELGLAIDLGVSFDLTRNVALRLSGTVGSDDDFIIGEDAFGVSLAWTTGFVRR